MLSAWLNLTAHVPVPLVIVTVLPLSMQGQDTLTATVMAPLQTSP